MPGREHIDHVALGVVQRLLRRRVLACRQEVAVVRRRHRVDAVVALDRAVIVVQRGDERRAAVRQHADLRRVIAHLQAGAGRPRARHHAPARIQRIIRGKAAPIGVARHQTVRGVGKGLGLVERVGDAGEAARRIVRQAQDAPGAVGDAGQPAVRVVGIVPLVAAAIEHAADARGQPPAPVGNSLAIGLVQNDLGVAVAVGDAGQAAIGIEREHAAILERARPVAAGLFSQHAKITLGRAIRAADFARKAHLPAIALHKRNRVAAIHQQHVVRAEPAQAPRRKIVAPHLHEPRRRGGKARYHVNLPAVRRRREAAIHVAIVVGPVRRQRAGVRAGWQQHAVRVTAVPFDVGLLARAAEHAAGNVERPRRLRGELAAGWAERSGDDARAGRVERVILGRDLGGQRAHGRQAQRANGLAQLAAHQVDLRPGVTIVVGSFRVVLGSSRFGRIDRRFGRILWRIGNRRRRRRKAVAAKVRQHGLQSLFADSQANHAAVHRVAPTRFALDPVIARHQHPDGQIARVLDRPCDRCAELGAVWLEHHKPDRHVAVRERSRQRREIARLRVHGQPGQPQGFGAGNGTGGHENVGIADRVGDHATSAANRCDG